MRLTQTTSLSSQYLELKLTRASYSRLYIAYSGGIDSHVLLHLCASINDIKEKITAVYVDHGLQVEAESWGNHCEHVCGNLGVKFINLKANAKAATGESPEEAARNARYAAMKPLLGKDDLLLVAHHAEDQLETVLLQLFRGSGLKGLSGMPPSMAFGHGRLVRPLLDVSKAVIIDYAKAHGLKWIEDPSNQHTHFDRNFLRHDIIPALRVHWPSLGRTVSRAAKHCANAQDLLNSLADEWLMSSLNPSDNTLSIKDLQNFSLSQQGLIIRHWFQRLGLRMPSEDIVQRILEQIIAARKEANPIVSTQGVCIRRFRDALYCLKRSQKKTETTLSWPSSEANLIVNDDAVYQVVKSTAGISCELWKNSKVTVNFRSGGETIELPQRKGHHDLKKLYQEAGIPPWERAVIPLIYLDDQLAAVGDLWISSAFYSDKQKPCLRIVRHKINPKGNDDTPDVD